MLEEAGKVGFSGLTEKHRIGKESRIGRKQARERDCVGLQPPLRPCFIFCPLEESDSLVNQKFKVTKAWRSQSWRFTGKHSAASKRNEN